MNQYIQKLKKELARNKAKSAVLGLLCLVAAYYWLPLLGKLLPSKKKAATAISEAEIVAQLPIPLNPVSGGPSSTTTIPAATDLSWQEIAKAISADVYMTSVASDPTSRSPFAVAEPVIKKSIQTDSIPADEDDPAEPNTPELTVDFVVTSVIVGSRRSVATINGVSYKLGDSVRSSDAEFQIVGIDAESISVTNGGEEIQVPVSKPWASPTRTSPTFR
jgi:hypothetical protein